ncbi:acyl-CoA dehydrogenase family protein [Mycolicibacterium vinylchloridicum]|uniref:acyl-CoA dehydrogenase family protein n=1 Tax=Mycolicibacterium vinylchloridicum TaxID=2736928 RepID=UPI0015C81B59|nr:acyl-CoA dehydrogenase family protein [Mycolicibacterium vinylchloridicum]
MEWYFENDPDFEKQLVWVDQFVTQEIEPLDLLLGHPADVHDPLRNELIRPLQQQVKDRDLWAAHLGPELGGQGYGQLRLALLNEIVGRSRCAPVVFGSQAPDSGNAEILAHFGTDEQKARYLQPLLAGDIVSCFSITEPTGGADPTSFTTAAHQDGDEWVINGEKWFSSNARYAEFLIVMAVTDPEAGPHRRMSMLLVPAGTPGVEIVRNSATAGQPFRDGTHAYLRFTDVRVPSANLLGDRGAAFAIAQTRLGGGRIHHAMRCVGLVQRALDMMCERVLSRSTRGAPLANRQTVQELIADSWMELQQYRLLVLQTAWRIDKYNDYQKVRGDISAVKALMPKVLNNVASRALHLHGSIGTTDEMPFARMILESFQMGLADGPTEVHKVMVAREVLKNYQPTDSVFPAYHLISREAEARQRYRDELARHEAVTAWA